MMPKIRTRAILLISTLVTATAMLSACIPLVVGGAAATTAVVATDRRSSGTQLDDQNITFRIESQAAQKLGNTARVNATVYNGQVLLTGDVPTAEAKSQAVAIARGTTNVRNIADQLSIGPISSFSSISNDTWITSKVRAALVNTKYVPSRTISVTTDKGVVYLMGQVTQAESDYAANAAADINGVIKVVKVFDIISREEALRLSGKNTQAAPVESAPTHATDDTKPAAVNENGVQVMPIQ